jgi:hypothetical protein
VLSSFKKRKIKNVEKTSKAIEDYLEAFLMLEEKKAATRHFVGGRFAQSLDASCFPNGQRA